MNSITGATVIGGRGYIGSYLTAALEADGVPCWVPDRDDPLLFARDLGHVFYCAGTRDTSSQRGAKMEQAHVALVSEILSKARFSSLLYVSSTRVYMRASSGREDALLAVDPGDPEQLFNITKIAGESVCLSVADSKVRVARVSNVYGPGAPRETFLPSILFDALRNDRIILRSAPETAKDYISIADCVESLVAIQRYGTERLYNVASGSSITHAEILEKISRRTGAEIEVLAGARRVDFPQIDVLRLRKLVPRRFSDLLEDLDVLIDSYRTVV